MALKIMIDAGHYGYVNQSPADRSYWESHMNWSLHLKLKAALERCGCTVGTTRPQQEKDLGLVARGKKAKGYDLFLSLHSNALSGAVDNVNDRPVMIHYLDAPTKDKELAQKLGDTIRDCMGAKQKTQLYTKRGDYGEWYSVLWGAKDVDCPTAFIVEHGFHTNPACVAYLLKDANLTELAEAEAKVLCEHYGVKYVAPGGEPKPKPAPAKSVPDVSLRVYSDQGYYLPWVKNNNDYAGNLGHGVQGVQCGLSKGKIRYRVRALGNARYYAWVENYGEGSEGYAGVYGKNIDALQMDCTDKDLVAVYRVHLLGGGWLPWVRDYGTGDDGYAGIYGRVIDAIEVKIEKR